MPVFLVFFVNWLTVPVPLNSVALHINCTDIFELTRLDCKAFFTDVPSQLVVCWQQKLSDIVTFTGRIIVRLREEEETK